MRTIRSYSLVNRRRRKRTARFSPLQRSLGAVSLGAGQVLLLALVLALGGLGLVYASLTNGLPSVTRVPELLDPSGGPLMQPTRLYDRSGARLLYSLENPGFPRKYLYVDPSRPEHFSPELIRATVAVIDPDFWINPGFRPGSLFSPQPETIAERVAFNLLLWQEPPGWQRAVRMRLLAAQLISQYGRSRVLEWYLNSAYYGHLAYGAESAAKLYLNRSAGELNLAGAALLLAAQQAPALNPLDAPQAAVERQQAILEDLYGRKIISARELKRALETKLSISTSAPESASPARAFSRLVIGQLEARFGADRVERGGLRVITSLDYVDQLELNCLLQTQLLRLRGVTDASLKLPDGSECQSAQLTPTLAEGEPQSPLSLVASAVVLDPATGQVLALAGDTTSAGEGDRLSPRPPGSLLSPFVAVTAFARGIGPATLEWDIPASLPADLEAYAPSSRAYHGPVRLRTALANDYLAPVAQLLEQMGPQNVWRLAGALGVNSLGDQTASSLLYTGGNVSLLEMAQAYGIIASGGVRSGKRVSDGGDVLPVMALYVEELDGGGVLWDGRQSEQQTVLTAPLAYLIHHVLSDAEARQPSQGYPSPFEIGRPGGAKLGQVWGGEQAWAAGYTRERAAVFWIGQAQGRQGALDPRLAAGLWHAYMQYLHRDLPAEDWTEPPGLAHVSVCDPSGLLPTDSCPDVVNELFLTGSEPVAADPLYRVYQINRETGRLATVFTPPALIFEKTFLVVPQEARAWALSAGLTLPPVDYDAIQPIPPSADVNLSSPLSYAYLHGKVTITGTAAGAGFKQYQLQAGQGLNPRDWLQITAQGAESVRDGALGVWDTTGLNGLYALRLLVVRTDQTVETAVIQVTVDNQPPQVRIQYPLAGQELESSPNQTVIFQAEANDGAGVTRLAWFLDGSLVGDSVQPPYILAWHTTRGGHTLVVKAYDQAGNEGESIPVQFSVK